MSSPKETPRQKMIGMMYLFYTALLALNVSAEVLSAFSLVDGSLRKTNEITEGSIDNAQSEFQKAFTNDSASVAPYKLLSEQVVAEANKTYDTIQYFKDLLVCVLEGAVDATATMPDTAALRAKAFSDGILDAHTVDVDELLTKKDDNNVGGQIFIQDGRSKEIQSTIEQYRQVLIDIVNKDTSSMPQAVAGRNSLITNIQSTLNTNKIASSNGEADSIDWSIANFEHLPAAGVLTLMTKMQADVRNTESSMLNYLLSQIGKNDMKFNCIKAVVNSPSNYVLVGQQYKAEVFIAAYDSTQTPDIVLNGGGTIPVSQGVGVFTGNTSSVGIKSWGGVIKLKNKTTGEIKEYPFSSQYEVGQPSVSVSPTKMNVFYIGVDNPVEIQASGVPAEKINASLAGAGSITRKGGANWVVRVKTPGKVNIRCSAQVDGGTKDFGSKEFRVKSVPDPIAMVGNLGDGQSVSKSLLTSQFVRAELKDFDFDLKFKITKFSVSANVKGFEKTAHSQSASFTSEQKSLINGLPQNSRVYLEGITAVGPDGTPRKLGRIMFTVK
ncbi:MAG: hypothetical protein MJ211_10245 [Bacteroidales bacterium]|nr:hypothetical protein [Bacteroidales bacterium]